MFLSGPGSQIDSPQRGTGYISNHGVYSMKTIIALAKPRTRRLLWRLQLACLCLLSGLAMAGADLPPWQPRFNRSQPVIAVVAENGYTELTDYVVPYGVLRESGVAQVWALATQAGPVRLFPALRVSPQASTAEFDGRFPQGADYVIVPAVHEVKNAALISWVQSQARKGATIVGVCDGVWVLAHAGLLRGKQAVGHWYALDDLQQQFADTRWRRDRRYLADGKVITTTGVTASIPVSLALVEAIAGTAAAQQTATRLGASDWSTQHRSDDFQLNRRHMLTAAGNWLAFWTHQDIGIQVADGVDEIALALAADAWSRTYRSSAFALPRTGQNVQSRRGLQLLADTTKVERTLQLNPALLPTATLDDSLRQIAAWYGPATAAFVALQMEYPDH